MSAAGSTDRFADGDADSEIREMQRVYEAQRAAFLNSAAPDRHARIESLGARRMPGMAKNLTAKVEDQYSHARFSAVKERADAPLEDALALLVRERLTGLQPPENVRRLVAGGHIREGYAERWRSLLARPVAEVASAISANSQDARDLRQNSPFAGVLNEQERRRIIETTR